MSCPSSIRTQQKLADPIASWDVEASDTSNRLIYVELYNGPPGNEQAIEPDETRDQAKEEILIWRFSGEPAKEGIWLLCGYQQTQVRLLRMLPDAVRECTQTNSNDRSRVVRLLTQTCR